MSRRRARRFPPAVYHPEDGATIYAARCEDCGHDEGKHLEVIDDVTTGRYVSCRVEGCGCERYARVWPR